MSAAGEGAAGKPGAHPGAAARLRRAAAGGRLSHAYLLVGPAGAAQALALDLAMAALCDRGGGDPGCDCPSCQAVRGGWHPDLRLVDLSGTVIRIAQVREATRAASLSPVRGRRRAFIIFPADRLTAPAANAMLKMLEDPPPPALFVLVTEKRFSLPPTVMSRCQMVRVDDAAAGEDALAAEWDEVARRALEQAAAAGGGFLEAAAAVMARAADGDVVPFLDALQRELHRRLASQASLGAGDAAGVATGRLAAAVAAVEGVRSALTYHANARLGVEALLIVAARALSAAPAAGRGRGAQGA